MTETTVKENKTDALNIEKKVDAKSVASIPDKKQQQNNNIEQQQKIEIIKEPIVKEKIRQDKSVIKEDNIKNDTIKADVIEEDEDKKNKLIQNGGDVEIKEGEIIKF